MAVAVRNHGSGDGTTGEASSAEIPRHLEVVPDTGSNDVQRLQRYKLVHPHVVIHPPNAVAGGQWQAFVDGRRIAHENQLGDLITELERMPPIAAWRCTETDSLRRIEFQLADIRWRFEPPWQSDSGLWEASHKEYGIFTAECLSLLMNAVETVVAKS